jgi:Flp pilus assembly pilin Flp
MNKKTSFFHFLRDGRGATSIEYAIIASGIAGALIATIGLLGTTVEQMWTRVGGIFN